MANAASSGDMPARPPGGGWAGTGPSCSCDPGGNAVIPGAGCSPDSAPWGSAYAGEGAAGDKTTPAGCTAAAAGLHVSRTVCRRAERQTIEADRVVGVSPLTIVYLNRLSDLLFILARAANALVGAPEVLWLPGGERS